MEFILMMDNDSGYVSHNQESNLDSSSENICAVGAPKSRDDLYLNEDALLEIPTIQCNFNQNEQLRKSDSFDSVINTSQESVKTEFSGFEDSDSSFVIPEAPPIVYCKNVENSNIENIFPKKLCTTPEKPPASATTTSKSSSHKVLGNVTNTYEQNQSQQIAKYYHNDKENIPPSETPKKRYHNQQTSDLSPDLFEEEESFLNMSKEKSPMKKPTPKSSNHSDLKLLKNVQTLLCGVHPPPSVTIIQIGVQEMLAKINENKSYFWKSSTVTNDARKSLLISDNEKCLAMEWPEILKARYHGLHYNKSKISEDFEHLCLKYAERYVGVETQSSCTIFDSNLSSSPKRKLTKPRWGVKSPGRRLSHLARRRITFSSANLQANSSAILGSRTRQILVDARKLSMLKKSPKKSPRKTPSKSPFKIRKSTPSSSAKKKLALRFREMSGELENIVPSGSSEQAGLTFKRALFSNEKDSGSSSMEKKSTKRALFLSPHKHSPKKSSPLKNFALDRKRKRTDTEGNISKLARSSSENYLSKTESNSALNRFRNDSFNPKPEELSDQHKKKLQWAVYESLRLQEVTPSHSQFKIFASVLARVTRKFLPSLKTEGSTTDKMFRIARYHSYAVVKGKTVDEIFNEYMKNRQKNQKPQGYVGLDELKQKTENVEKENILQDKSNILESKEKTRHFSQNRIERIKKVISFEERD